jgi:hypothetical protein
MIEKVGICHNCGKDIHCLDGFLDGVLKECLLLCFDCDFGVELENKTT